MEMIMSTLTMRLEDIASPAANPSPSTGLFTRLIRARETSANRRVVAYLASQSDERLAALGVDANDIASIRAGKLHIPA
jgi:hypothetical protein